MDWKISVEPEKTLPENTEEPEECHIKNSRSSAIFNEMQQTRNERIAILQVMRSF